VRQRATRLPWVADLCCTGAEPRRLYSRLEMFLVSLLVLVHRHSSEVGTSAASGLRRRGAASWRAESRAETAVGGGKDWPGGLLGSSPLPFNCPHPLSVGAIAKMLIQPGRSKGDGEAAAEAWCDRLATPPAGGAAGVDLGAVLASDGETSSVPRRWNGVLAEAGVGWTRTATEVACVAADVVSSPAER